MCFKINFQSRFVWSSINLKAKLAPFWANFSTGWNNTSKAVFGEQKINPFISTIYFVDQCVHHMWSSSRRLFDERIDLQNKLLKNAFIICGRLRDAYLEAVKKERVNEIQRILDAARQATNQKSMVDICEKWLKNYHENQLRKEQALNQSKASR